MIEGSDFPVQKCLYFVKTGRLGFEEATNRIAQRQYIRLGGCRGVTFTCHVAAKGGDEKTENGLTQRTSTEGVKNEI